MSNAEYFSTFAHIGLPFLLGLWALVLAYERRWRDTPVSIGIGLLCAVSMAHHFI